MRARLEAQRISGDDLVCAMSGSAHLDSCKRRNTAQDSRHACALSEGGRLVRRNVKVGLLGPFNCRRDAGDLCDGSIGESHERVDDDRDIQWGGPLTWR
jgi:hypothetical protein